jgi:hypothetical protein
MAAAFQIRLLKGGTLVPVSGLAILRVESPQISSKKISNFLNTIKALKLNDVSDIPRHFIRISQPGHSFIATRAPNDR